MKDQILNPREAAELVGCSRATVRRAVATGELASCEGWGRRGRETQVRRDELLRWWACRSGGQVEQEGQELGPLEQVEPQPIETVGQFGHVQVDRVETVGQVRGGHHEPVGQHDRDEHEALGHQCQEIGHVGQVVPLVAHSQALDVASKALDRARDLELQLYNERERSARAERAAEELRHTLASYQRALSEQAESLAEERAKARAAEAVVAQDAEAKTPVVSTPLSNPSTARTSWGARMRRWLLGERTG